MSAFKITTHKKMSDYEERKAHIMACVLRLWNKRTNKELANLYCVSARTIIRYKKEIKPFVESGSFTVAHKGRKNENALKYKDETINKIMCDYYDFTEEFFPKNATINTAPFSLYYHEKVKQIFNISYAQAFKRVKKQGFANVQMTRKYKNESKKIRRLLEQEIGEKISLFTRIGSLEIDEREKKRKSVYQAKNIHLKFGENVELDACKEVFFGNKKVFIYHAIDSSTVLKYCIYKLKKFYKDNGEIQKLIMNMFIDVLKLITITTKTANGKVVSEINNNLDPENKELNKIYSDFRYAIDGLSL
ncbi:transposase domain-containing protein [Mycoplasmopsis glycophila]|uniref:Transposase domain-containing protein n=1 Tax=Mycoplasmopsis glycophila TaxID=171285 RepID=A0A449AWU1_9BACT|nr:transposase domain-containing protein [Mycoplasmopsis glycophila]